ncbi:unnamed protein product, partial [Discosporangium mesarthrocarpum]
VGSGGPGHVCGWAGSFCVWGLAATTPSTFFHFWKQLLVIHRVRAYVIDTLCFSFDPARMVHTFLILSLPLLFPRPRHLSLSLSLSLSVPPMKKKLLSSLRS